MKAREVRAKGKYLETFSALGDTWSVWELGGKRYCFSHTAEAFDKEAYPYSGIVEVSDERI